MWRLPVDDPTPEPHERTTEMHTQPDSANPHLTAARKLLDEIDAATGGPDGDARAKAGAATAHAMLVLAEQVAAARLTMTRVLVQQKPQEARR